MNCVELQHSLAEVEDASGVEQRAHLMECPACSELVRELDMIIEAAGELQSADEPSPHLWMSIASTLREEGIIRPQVARNPVSSFGLHWGAARWLVPAAALLLLTVGIYVRRQAMPGPIALQTPVVTSSSANAADLDDADLLQEVAANTPAMKIQYEENLRQVNQSIREAQGFVDQSPNDEEASRSLMDAYQQKSMLFQMAMDHPAQ